MKKLITGTEVLKDALKKLGLAVSRKPAIPALSNLYLKASAGSAELITTDLELTISCSLPCECNDTFEMLIPFDFVSRLLALLGTQPLTIEYHSATKGALVADGETYKLDSLDKVKDFPEIPTVPVKNVLEFDEEMMKWLERVTVCVTKDELRPAMTQACLEIDGDGVTMVSTDAHVLCRKFFAKPSSIPAESVLIGPRVSRALHGAEKATFSWRQNHVAMVSEKLTVIQTRVDARFPDYKVVIPNSKPTLDLDRNLVLGALMKAELVNKRQVDFRFADGVNDRFSVCASDIGFGLASEVTVACVNCGKTAAVAFDPILLTRLLADLPFDMVKFHIDGPSRGIVITSDEDESFLGLIMPLLLNN